MPLPDYYAILNLAPSATPSDIKTAYRTLAKQYHPDVVGDAPDKVLQYNYIKTAYETLINQATRNQYHEQRWLCKAEGKAMANNTPVTAETLYKQLLSCEQLMSYSNYNLTSVSYAAQTVTHILQPQHLPILTQVGNSSITQAIFTIIIKLLPQFNKNQYFAIVMVLKDNAGLLNNANKKALAQAQKNYELTTILVSYKWVIAVLLTILLVLIIWKFG